MILTRKFHHNSSILIMIVSRFLATGQTGNVIVPKDSSITKAGGTEMSTIDKQKLAYAYGDDEDDHEHVYDCHL